MFCVFVPVGSEYVCWDCEVVWPLMVVDEENVEKDWNVDEDGIVAVCEFTFDKKGYRVVGFVVMVSVGCGCGVMVPSCVLVRCDLSWAHYDVTGSNIST
jgi:hypothetical protein